MVIVLMGAAGAGKTTVGRQLSEELRWPFLDGDEVHPHENIAKMSRGMPLTDEDRRPWMQALRKSIAEWLEQGINAVLTCSLLTHAHRAAVLAGYEPHVKLAYLQASRALLRERLTTRTGHFAGVALLESQLALLEEPSDALVLDASRLPEQLVQTIRAAFRL
jgi:gluconokinase